MPTQHWKGPTIPGAGDPLLESWQTYTDTAGIIITASTVAAARVIATQRLTSVPGSITTAQPAIFNIDGTLYVCDGTRDGNGNVVIRGVNRTNGLLHTWTDTADGAAAQTWMTLGTGTINLPSDRLVEFKLSSCVSGPTGSASRGVLGFSYLLDNAVKYSFEREYTSTWDDIQHSIQLTVPAGSHTVAFSRGKRSGDDFRHHYGMSGGLMFPGTRFEVYDRGVA